MYALTKPPEKREEKFRLSLFNMLELKELNIDSLECFSFFFFLMVFASNSHTYKTKFQTIPIDNDVRNDASLCDDLNDIKRNSMAIFQFK